MEPAIRTEHLTKIYSDRTIAVNDMNLEVPQGSIFGLLGPNGAGKTTTLRLLVGLQRATAGWAEVFGHRCGPNAVEVRRLIGYLPTHPNLPGNLRLLEYLDLLGRLCRLPAEVCKPRVASLVRAVGLLGVTDQRIDTLSTGETTRLGIAASLVGDPPLLVWDEPTAGLDPAARRFTLDLIRQLGKSRTVVVATHILSDIDQICDHVGVMHEGRMIFCGSVQEMKQHLRRDDFYLELDAPAEQIRPVLEQIGAVEGVDARLEGDRTVVLHVHDQRSRAGALADVLRVVENAGVGLGTIRSPHDETETAYLQLLREDEAHGFHRFDFDTPHPDHAVSGNSAA